MKKVILFCLSIILISFTVNSQSFLLKGNQKQNAPVQKELVQKSNQTWEVQFTDTIESLCKNPVGAVSDGNYLYTGCSSLKMIYKIDSIHKVVDTISITNLPDPTNSGVPFAMVGLTYDDTYFYATNGNDSIYQIDLSLKSVTNIITLPTGTTPLGIAYAPEADGGNGAFWISILKNNSLFLFSRTGVLLDSIMITDPNYYYSGSIVCALTYDNITEGGPFLYTLEYQSGLMISINLSTKGVNALPHSIFEDMIDWFGLSPFGLYIQPNVISGTTTLGAIFQSGEHIGYNLDALKLPNGLNIIHSYTKPWLRIGETGTVSANVYCSGKAPVTSYDYHYSIDGNQYSQSVSAVNFNNGYIHPITLTHDSIIAPLSVGIHNLNIWFSNINGNSTIISDTLSMTIEVYQKVTQRTVLHEQFSSSADTNGRILNKRLDTIFAQNPNKFVCIKYQMNIPSFDPYYTMEGQTRFTYYEPDNVPYLTVDGNYFNDNLGYYSSSLFQLEYVQPSFVELSATFTRDDTRNYSTSIKVTPLKTFTGNYKLYAALVEKVTTCNSKDSLQKKLYYVFKKFMTDANGLSVTLTEDQNVNEDVSFQFKGGFRIPFNTGNLINYDIEHSIEDFNNLMLVYWIQEYDTKEVLQSGKVDAATLSVEDYSDNSNVKVYPNPSEGILNIVSDKEFSNVKIVNILGQVVYNVNVNADKYSCSTSEMVPGLYILQLQTENGLINRKITIK